MKFLLVLSWLAGIINITVFYKDGSFFGTSAILLIIPTMIFICYNKFKTVEAKIDASNEQKDKKNNISDKNT